MAYPDKQAADFLIPILIISKGDPDHPEELLAVSKDLSHKLHHRAETSHVQTAIHAGCAHS